MKKTVEYVFIPADCTGAYVALHCKMVEHKQLSWKLLLKLSFTTKEERLGSVWINIQ